MLSKMVIKRRQYSAARARRAYRKRMLTMRRKRMRSGRMRVSRNLRPYSLSVVRRCAAGSALTFSSTATENFYQFCSVALTAGFRDFTTSRTVIAQLTNLSEYTALFEQFRLNAFKIEFMPRFYNINADANPPTTGTTTRNMPQVLIIKDPTFNVGSPYTGTWSRTFLNGLLENGRGRIYRGDRKITVYMKNTRVQEEYGGGARRYIRPQFTDINTTAGQAMEHRGFHMFVYNNTFDNASFPVFDVYVTYYLQFRNPK